MRKFFTALVLIPLGLIFVVFAVANRHLVTVSFDPFNSSDPSRRGHAAAVRRHHRGGDFGRGGGRLRDLVPAAPLAARGAPARGRCAAGAGATGRSARQRRAPPGGDPQRLAARRRRAADTGPPGETSRARRCRTRPQFASLFRAFAPPLLTCALNHVPDRQNLRPVHARDARRRAAGRRRHGRVRVLSAVAAPSQPRDGARSRQAGQGPRDEGGADGRCRRRDARQHRRGAAARSLAVARQGNRGAAARHQAEIRLAGDEGDRGRDLGRSRAAARLCRGRRSHPVRCPRAEGRHPSRRSRRGVRLASAGESRPQAAVHGLGRPQCRQCRGSRSRHRAPAASMFPPAWSARPASRIPR